MKRLLPWAFLAVALGASCTLDLAGKPPGGSSGEGGATAASGAGPGGGTAASTSGAGGDPSTTSATTSTTATTVTAGSSASSAASSSSTGGGPVWARRRRLDLDSGINGTFNNVPILVILKSDRIDYAQTQDQGQDLRFVDDQSQVLDHEIERWDESGVSIVWVRIPSLHKTGGNLTSIWMYYGNDSAPDGQDESGVWSDGYRGVWHLAESGDLLTDSSGKTGSNAKNYGSTPSDGRIGKGRSFDAGNHQYIDTLNAEDLATFTIEAWARSDSAPVKNNGPNGVLMREQNYQICWDHMDPFGGAASFRPEAPQDWLASDLKPLSGNTWYYLAATYDGTKLRTFKDGASQNNDVAANKPRPETNTAKIGRHAFGTTTAHFFHGDIDEVRISAKSRSANWISIQAKSMTDNNLVKFNGEDAGGPWSAPP